MGVSYLIYKQVALLLTTCILLSGMAHAQFKEPNRPDHDALPYYFGIHLAYNNTYLHPSKSYKFLQDDSILTAEPGASGGVALGFLATFRYDNRFEFRLNPNLVIGGAKYFTYTLKNPLPGEALTQKKTLPSSIFTFPVQVKFNSDRIDNFRVYLLLDGYVSTDLMANAGNRNAEDLIKLKKNDYGVETGIGCNLYMKFVTLSPELKFTYGMANLHARDANLKYSSVFDKLQSRMITFSLNIEQ
ncbi:type IX secretion/gliding motility protein PorT/SprT [Panacibacter ginsenosidivorans]|nr:outer membrane beta-barrel protein [Panacibacter ginsenosidivorans]